MRYLTRWCCINYSFILLLFFVFDLMAETEFTRIISDNETSSPIVNLSIQPENDVKCYAIEEIFPIEITPTNINENGIWDTKQKIIKWGPFCDSQNRNFTYQISGQDNTYIIYGKAGIDSKLKLIPQVSVTITNKRYEQVEKTVFSVQEGTQVPVLVSITCPTEDAQIRYTTDGSIPDSNSSLYTDPINLTNKTILRARGYKQGMEPGDVTISLYPDPPEYSEMKWTAQTIQACSSKITFTVQPRENITSYAIEELLPPGLIPESINENGQWDLINNKLKWGPFLDNDPRMFSFDVMGIANTYSIEGKAGFDNNNVKISEIIQFNIDCDKEQVQAPVIEIFGEEYAPVTISVYCPTPEADIYYTTDYTSPDRTSNLYTEPLHISSAETLIFRAIKENMIPSMHEVVIIQEDRRTFVRTITHNGDCSFNVKIRVIPENTVKNYAVEEYLPLGLIPENINESGTWIDEYRTIKWGSFVDSNTRILSYDLYGNASTYNVSGKIAFDATSKIIEGNNQINISCIEFRERVSSPVFQQITDTQGKIFVDIICPTDGSKIYYTFDGTLPDTNSSLYESPILLSPGTTIRAAAFKNGMQNSSPVVFEYPSFISDFKANVSRKIIDNESCTPSVNISFTPIENVISYAYEEILPNGLEPFDINENGKWDEINNKIKWGPFDDNKIKSLLYNLKGPDNIYLLTGVAGVNSSKINTLNDKVTIYCTSRIDKVESPELSIQTGAQVPVEVVISCNTQDVQIYYTLDGSIPDTNSLLYSNVLSFDINTILRVRAFKDGMKESEIISAFFPEKIIEKPVERYILNNESCISHVLISVVPNETVKTYAIEENLPELLIPFEINQEGNWDKLHNKLKWGPFKDNKARTLSYKVTGINMSHMVSGVASFNGKIKKISNYNEIIISCNFENLNPDLSKIIMILKILARIEYPEQIFKLLDANGDKIVGIEDAVIIMHLLTSD